MKRLSIILVLVFVAFANASNAQQLSVKAGLNLSNLNDNDGVIDYETKLGFNIGVGAEFGINDMFTFEPAVLISAKGTQIKDLSKINFLYAEIPLNLKAYFDVTGIKIYGLLGPYLGIGLTGKTKFDPDLNLNDLDIEWGDDLGEFKRLDYGVNIGAGIDLGKIQIGAQYGLGLADISSDIKHSVIAINVGYKF